MSFDKDLILRSQEIAKQVMEAEKLRQPIEGLVREQIRIMESHHDEFVKQATDEGIDNLSRAKIEISLYNNIRVWANKIGLSTEKYDNAIREIRVKFLGEHDTKKYYG